MEAPCRKCGHVAEVSEISATTACPQCGAVYAKVEAEIARKAAKDAEDVAAAAAKAKADEEYAARLADARARAAENERLSAEQSVLNKHVCLACGRVGKPKKVVKGSFAVEILLWGGGLLLCASIIGLHLGVILLVVAFCYSIWRVIARRHRACPSCGSEQIIPANSPKGREELAKQGLIRTA